MWCKFSASLGAAHSWWATSSSQWTNSTFAVFGLSLTSESIRYNSKLDALLSIEALETGIDYYVPEQIDPADPLVSPLFDDLADLPPTLVQVGSKEILLDDAQRFKDKATKAGVDVTFKLYTGMWHNFQMFNAWFPEAKMALDDIATFAQALDQD